MVSIDGGGDGRWCRVFNVTNWRFEPLHDISTFDSIGNSYAYVPQVCGFKAGRHEGKVTGLAAYGKPTCVPQFQKIIREQDGEITNVANVFYKRLCAGASLLLRRQISRRGARSVCQSSGQQSTRRRASTVSPPTAGTKWQEGCGVACHARKGQQVRKAGTRVRTSQHCQLEIARCAVASNQARALGYSVGPGYP